MVKQYHNRLGFLDKIINTDYDSYVAQSLGPEIKQKAEEMRKRGFSLGEISDKLNIAKSTASVWVKNVKLNNFSRKRIAYLKIQARQKASQVIRDKHNLLLYQIMIQAQKTLSILDIHNPNICKIICSLLYWGEGGKVDRSMSFVNSDPRMIFTFISLLRRAFDLDERKFRLLVHIHEYHNDNEIKSYWSKITKIPLSQFNKSYLKPHTGKIVRENFKGTVRVNYYNVKIAHELKAIYNTLAESIGT